MTKPESVTSVENSPVDYYQRVRSLPRAHSVPIRSAVYRDLPEDFRVSESLGFAAAGEGDHILLQISKRDLNTQDVIELLTQRFAVKSVDVGYCGMKDRNAVTDQWLSVHLPGQTDQALLELGLDDSMTTQSAVRVPELANGVQLLSAEKHNRKLRIGSHRANRFELTLKHVEGDLGLLEERFRALGQKGFPNYFGAQRFGREARNLYLARSWLTATPSNELTESFRTARVPGKQKPRRRRKISRAQRSLYLSAARAFLFNELLAARIQSDTWLTVLPGEPLMLEGSRSFFIPEPESQNDIELVNRIVNLDVHTSGVLWGSTSDKSVCMDYERVVLSGFPEFLQGLEREGLNAARRALRVVPRQLTFKAVSDTTVNIGFELPAGAYATALLRELVSELRDSTDS